MHQFLTIYDNITAHFLYISILAIIVSTARYVLFKKMFCNLETSDNVISSSCFLYFELWLISFVARSVLNEVIITPRSLMNFWCLSPKRRQAMLWRIKVRFYWLCMSLTSAVSMIDLCGFTALFGVFIETNKH